MADHLPLNALRAFEVAARTGSFVSAGAELGVTAAAVSQQVKSLESTLGKTLFLRQGNRITLTEAGRALYPELEAVFSKLVGMTRELRAGPQRARLVVSALPSLAELWLVPALATYPDRQEIDLRIEPDPVHFARAGVDLRVTYGALYYPDHHAQVLFRDHYIAVASPALARHAGADPASLADEQLIHTQWGPDYVNQPDWSQWFAALGHSRRPEPGTGLRTNQTSASVMAARGGIGVALVPSRLAAFEIAQGTLARVGHAEVRLTWDYVLVHPEAFVRRARLTRLTAHLMRSAQAGE